MDAIIRLTNIELFNFKNVKYGKIETNSLFDNLKQADVLGIYGQNGSGKTAVVEALDLLKVLLSGSNQEKSLPELSEHLHYFKEEEMTLVFNFVIHNSFGEYFVQYTATLLKGDENICVSKEKLQYRENKKGHRYKTLLEKNQDEFSIRNNTIASMSEKQRVSVLVAEKLARSEFTSVIFRSDLNDTCESILMEEEFEVIRNLKFEFRRDLHVIKATNYGYLVANLVMPFSIHYENKRGEIPYRMDEIPLVSTDVFDIIESTVEQINVVLHKVIPDLYIKIKKINVQRMKNGKDGVRFEFLSQKGDTELPLKSESAGTLKIISILSTLIAVYNNPNACVVIDELDAGVFEFLLGEILEVISDNGKGQLIFTSHNLRILEVLPTQKLWFSTANEQNRYIQLKGVKKSNNIRDLYLRAIQLGGQNETVYAETNSFNIKKAFRKAGRYHG